ncbi:AAA family ATPase [Pantoea sp. LMR881]|uniref:AAA family ATPase n=1 Tax=Pantoea sp. LMR881 TaxID=3014336 RepID=UPI0022AE8CE7|nr:AAA family ATPase [Pantoea sp. LMR881]MCZ4061219.1 AAA family ATPase [Pantoea sp. LMR881]MCZ4061334.1 AAA family ATPase [Pantoea sp. LMR881]
MSDLIQIKIPTQTKENESISLEKGSVLFILGPNGSGKSSLIYNIMQRLDDRQKMVLLSAHRQVWFDDAVIDMSNAEYEQTLSFLNTNVKYTSEYRWKINDNRQNKLPIIRLKKGVNRRNRDLAAKVDARDFNGAVEAPPSPVTQINSVLKSSGMPISIYHDHEDNIIAMNSRYNPPSMYSVSELSDGEKNAIIISADVISSLPGTLFIIDEPERHLHRSISSPLLSELISIRPDCYFIVSTHDIGLASDMDGSQVLLVNSCNYVDKIAESWDVEYLTEPTLIPEHIRKDILGARKEILFIEGVNTSLDMGLYKAVFPEVTLISKEGCEDVSVSVRGVRNNDRLGWINAYGLVDNDNKKTQEIEKLRDDGIYTLKYHSIESIFYHPQMIMFFITHLGPTFNVDEKILSEINLDVIKTLDNESRLTDLCSLAVNKAVRWRFNEFTPNNKEGFTNKIIEIDAGDIYAEEVQIYKQAIHRQDSKFLIERYSIRRTGVIDKIIKKLNCPNKNFYESKIMSIVREDMDARDFVIGCLGGLYEAIYGTPK